MARALIVFFFGISVCTTQLLEKPWRKLKEADWTQEVHDKLQAQIQTHMLTEEAGIDNINVLLIGEVSAGKSSFINSVESLFTGYVTSRANSGMAERSLTTQYRKYVITARDKKKTPIKFKFCDTMGLEGGNAGLSAAHIALIMDGHVDDQAKLRREEGWLEWLGITDRLNATQLDGYIKNPTEDDRIHCVIFVVSASAVSIMDPAVLDKFKAIRDEANRRNLIPVVVLTKLDQICQATKEKTSKVFHSRAVSQKVKEVSQKFGINQNQIFPVRNYFEETECTLENNLLILQALRQILRNSEDYLKDRIAREAKEKKNMKSEL